MAIVAVRLGDDAVIEARRCAGLQRQSASSALGLMAYSASYSMANASYTRTNR
jgi:hypothetical protein